MSHVTIGYCLSRRGRREALARRASATARQQVRVAPTDLGGDRWVQLCRLASVSPESGDARIELRDPCDADSEEMRAGVEAGGQPVSRGAMREYDAPLDPAEAAAEALRLAAAAPGIERERIEAAMEERAEQARRRAIDYIEGRDHRSPVAETMEWLGDDLRRQVMERVRERQERERERQERERERQERERERQERERLETLAAVVHAEWPHLSQAWTDGLLCQAEPIAAAGRRIATVIGQTAREAGLPDRVLVDEDGYHWSGSGGCLSLGAASAYAQGGGVDLPARLRSALAEAYGWDPERIAVDTRVAARHLYCRQPDHIEADDDGDVRLGRVGMIVWSVDLPGDIHWEAATPLEAIADHGLPGQDG